jgi:hypothetical protein
MSKLSELLKQVPVDKATVAEVDELAELTGMKLPQQIFDVLQTSEGIINAIWIMQKRENPEITKEELSKQLTLDPDIELEIGYEALYYFSRLNREQLGKIKESAVKASDPNNKVFSTDDYKQFQSVIDEANKFMKGNKNAKFSVVVTCEFVPLEKKEDEAEKNEVTNQMEKPS